MSLALGLSKDSTFTIIHLKKSDELNKCKFKEEENKLLQASLKWKNWFLIKSGSWEVSDFHGLCGVSEAVYIG